MVYTTDDVCPSNLKYFKYWDKLKEKKTDLKVIAFTIANYQFREILLFNRQFERWWIKRRDWVEIGVHGYDHMLPQEGWRDNQKKYIESSLDILLPMLPERYLYRAPGFRVLPKTEKILRELGFAGIAHQGFIKYFDTGQIIKTFDTHCSNKFHNPIIKIWKKLAL